MKTVVVATHNAHKLTEIREILNIPNWEFVSLSEMGITDVPEENATSFVGNARIKALSAHQKTGLAALADDSGLAVDALDGAPGVLSSRYAGIDGDDEANNNKLLSALQGKEGNERAAQFVCSMVLIDDDGREFTAYGECAGRIGLEPKGSNGFGYDPLFYPAEYDFQKTMGELSSQEKNAISHRFLALRNLLEVLSDSSELA